MSTLTLYHGTKDINFKPDFNFNNLNNDYGKGLYTTPYKELGKEWSYASYTSGEQGYVFEYTIDVTGLNILDFTSLDSLHWLAELAYNRKINAYGKEVLTDNIKRFIQKYKIDTRCYDIIIGYRADNSYFSYAEDFLSGLIYRGTVDKALRNGNLGIQVFIKSPKAFSILHQNSVPEAVDKKYAGFYSKRDKLAREKYISDKRNQSSRLKQTIKDFI